MLSLAGSGAVPAVLAAVRRLIGRSPLLLRLGRALFGVTPKQALGDRTAQAPVLQKPSVFDAEFYLSQVSPTECVEDPFEHYLTTGAPRGLDPHPLFDTSYYGHKYPDVVQARMNPLLHYLSFGLAERRTPHPLFETSPVVIQQLDERYPLYRKLFLERYRHPRRWYSSACPDVSIIVLAFNKSEFTVACLEAIWRHTFGAAYEVIVVDNGSEFQHVAAVAPFVDAFVHVAKWGKTQAADILRQLQELDIVSEHLAGFILTGAPAQRRYRSLPLAPRILPESLSRPLHAKIST